MRKSDSFFEGYSPQCGEMSRRDKGDGAVGGGQDRFPLFQRCSLYPLKMFRWNIFNEKRKCCSAVALDFNIEFLVEKGSVLEESTKIHQ
ncbi:MAG: hypothetical protein ACI4JQ_04895 [Ruminococcus sp.]